MLYFQLLGVAIRADVPVALDLLPCFWKSLKDEELTLQDIKDADVITYSLTKNIIEVGGAIYIDHTQIHMSHECRYFPRLLMKQLSMI